MRAPSSPSTARTTTAAHTPLPSTVRAACSFPKAHSLSAALCCSTRVTTQVTSSTKPHSSSLPQAPRPSPASFPTPVPSPR
ncbi:MAG: hypothetical protein EBV15_10820, partial [Bacteroidetes bacterium]|nr:hypothetical protein [Bacteroidota bacterium]